jgi:GntR family transcriptional regulator, transcriptional repressor for pyruvate dehydrogenase complex
VAATDQAIEGIRELIASGEVGPGGRLPKENELAARLGVSRGSLREAIRALELIGVVEARQGDGTYLTSLHASRLMEVFSVLVDFSQDESLLQLLEVRRLLEPSAAALAAARATPDDLAAVHAAMHVMEHADAPEALVEGDTAFHGAIAAATGNAALASLLENLASPTIRARIWRAATESQAIDETLAEHRRILEALEARDPEVARAASAMHVSRVERWLRGVLARQGAAATSEAEPAEGAAATTEAEPAEGAGAGAAPSH